jgi:hypothetical protein
MSKRRSAVIIIGVTFHRQLGQAVNIHGASVVERRKCGRHGFGVLEKAVLMETMSIVQVEQGRSFNHGSH